MYFLSHLAGRQGHPHAPGELRSGARQPERVGPGQDEGHGYWGETQSASYIW